MPQNMMTERLDTGLENCMNLSPMILTGTVQKTKHNEVAVVMCFQCVMEMLECYIR